MTKQLTAASVAKLKPGKKRREIPDGGCPGLYLIVQTSGAKSWAVRFRRPDGRRIAKLTLGPLDLSGKETGREPAIGAPLTLSAVRRLAAEVKHHRAVGQDVMAVRHREKLEREAHGAKTFAQAATDFIEQHSMRKTRRWKEQARQFGLQLAVGGEGFALIPRGLTHRWRDRAIAEIDGDDIHAIVDEVREKGVPGIGRRNKGPSEARARQMYRSLSKMFGWLIEKRRVRLNPCAGVHKPEAPASRERVLTEGEIKKLWAASNAVRMPFTQLLRLLLLTGCRLNEVAGMRRGELSDDASTWTIPSTRTKNKRVHVIPLPPMARDILKTLGSDGDLLFTTTGKTPVSGFSKLKKKLDEEMGVTGWRIHDIRRTCATGMAEIGIAPHIVEAVLNHVSGAKASVAGTYNRAAYAEQKRDALERWADHVERLVSGKTAKVVTLWRRKPT